MKKIVIASTGKGAGKSSLIIGLAKHCNKSIGYMKPLGDRLLYKKKRLWDHDAALITELFKLTENPEDITIGFEHSKLRYMYDEQTINQKLQEISNRTGKGKDILFIEGGMGLSYGSSVYLDSISLARSLDAGLVVVVNASEGVASDEVAFIKNYVDISKIKFLGVIINKVRDVEDFKQTELDSIKKTGLNVLGMIPYAPELTHLTVNHFSEYLLAKVVAGDAGLSKRVENIFVGAMSVDMAANNPLFKKENKLIITSGDRSDMILTAIDTKSAGVILTNNILPPSNIISKAAEKDIPLLVVPSDTYQVAKQLDNIEPLIMKEDVEKIGILARLVKENLSSEFC